MSRSLLEKAGKTMEENALRSKSFCFVQEERRLD